MNVTNMTYFNTVCLIVSFLGGGIVSALINWARANRADKKDREIKFLDNQIRKLYGPLYYLVSQSEKLFQLNNRFHEAYNKEYCNKKWSQQQHAQEILEGEASATIEIANKYIEIVEKNNEKMKEILDNHYSLLDPEDIETMMVFFEHHTRLNVEKNCDGKITTPFRIYENIGDISFLRPEVINKIKTQFLNKKRKLENLLK